MASSSSRSWLRQFKVMSFNLLAPCYFRYRGQVEAKLPTHFLPRARALVAPVLTEKCDIICLQEYWFDSEFQQVFLDALSPTHWSFTLKRPGRKEDGLAVFVAKDRFNVHDVTELTFDRSGERVSIMMHLSLKPLDDAAPVSATPPTIPMPATASQENSSFLLVNSHLTFPHSDFNRFVRIQQMNSTLEHVKNFPDIPVLMCGDFNDVHDEVHDRIVQDGFDSSFRAIHGREAGVTHCNHNLETVGVDFIFARNSENTKKTQQRLIIHPESSYLLPKTLADTSLLKRPRFRHDWNESSVTTVENEQDVIDDWSFISDHRPIVSTFSHTSSSI